MRKTTLFAFPARTKILPASVSPGGAPPEVILLQTGNCSTAAIEQIVRGNAVGLGSSKGLDPSAAAAKRAQLHYRPEQRDFHRSGRAVGPERVAGDPHESLRLTQSWKRAE